MTNKPMLTVERDLIERAVRAIINTSQMQPALNELRALLDEQDEPFNLQGWGIDHSAGRPILMHNKCSVIEAEQAYGLLNLIESADQQQGEPVAWIVTDMNGDSYFAYDRQSPSDKPLYAEQPAPVAVGEIYDLVIPKLGLTIMEDERILTIQKHTGCTRAQAQSLIDSGDI